MDFRESIYEHSACITDWEGARVRVSIEVPWLRNTMTSQMVISAQDVESLKNLRIPDSILRIEPESSRMIAMHNFKRDSDRAEDLVQTISNNIAHQIACAIAEDTEHG